MRPETSSCEVFEVELLVTEGSQMNITIGGKHQTWREREIDMVNGWNNTFGSLGEKLMLRKVNPKASRK